MTKKKEAKIIKLKESNLASHEISKKSLESIEADMLSIIDEIENNIPITQSTQQANLD